MKLVLQGLISRAVLQRRIALVVAHPDDETIAAGGSLHLMPGLVLVHVTDGAPRRLDDAGSRGFATPQAYAAAREAELQAALSIAGVAPERIRLGVPDQDAALHLCAIAADLGGLLARYGIEAVLTHAYEGGHPDHDATAFSVHTATRRLGIPVFEYAGYHAGADGTLAVQRFLPGPAETLVELGPEEAARKRAMLDCFRTQSGILSLFSPQQERFRPAPGYDFTTPPHPGPLNYEQWGWEMDRARWQSLVSAATEGWQACDF